MKVEAKKKKKIAFFVGDNSYLGCLKSLFFPYRAWVFLQLLILAFFSLFMDTGGVFAESGARRAPRARGQIFGRGHSFES